MKYFKITHKNKSKYEIRYLPADDLQDLKYDSKTKFLELEIRNILESGFTKPMNITNFEVFLTSLTSAIFTIELYETEEETC